MVMVDILGDIKSVKGAKKWDLKPMFFEVSKGTLEGSVSDVYHIAYEGSSP